MNFDSYILDRAAALVNRLKSQDADVKLLSESSMRQRKIWMKGYTLEVCLIPNWVQKDMPKLARIGVAVFRDPGDFYSTAFSRPGRETLVYSREWDTPQDGDGDCWSDVTDRSGQQLTDAKLWVEIERLFTETVAARP